MRADWLEDLAREFWARLGGLPPPPRDLGPLLPVHLPVQVVSLEGLSCRAVDRWLGRRGIELPLAVRDRPLNGCLVAYRGKAMVFVERTLADADRRVVEAHETAHFLLDYELPRQRAERRLGAAALEVLDGRREADGVEQIGAVLAGVCPGGYAHYLSRECGPRQGARTREAERRADALACGILAPAEEVRQEASRRRLGEEASAWRGLLEEVFGFPPGWAEPYARRLLEGRGPRAAYSGLLGL